MPSTTVMMKPFGSFGSDEMRRAIKPAIPPMMIAQMIHTAFPFIAYIFMPKLTANLSEREPPFAGRQQLCQCACRGLARKCGGLTGARCATCPLEGCHGPIDAEVAGKMPG